MKRGLNLVGTGIKQAPEPSNTRLVLGDYIADVLLDARHNAKIFLWIVQKVGSPAIVQWGQEYTFNDAKSAAQSYLELLNSGNEKTA